MSEVDFSILQPVNVGALTQQGFATGMAMVKQVQTKNALRAYLANPDNPQAYNALAAYDPETAQSILQQRREQHALDEAQAQATRRQTAGTQAAGGDIQGGVETSLKGGDLEFANALGKLDDDKKAQLRDMYKGAAPLAYQALKLPYAQRKAYIEQVKPQLEAAGWDSAKVDAFDPTDGNLGGIVQSNMTLDQAMGRDKIEYREVLPGARLVPFDAAGRPVTGDSGGAAPAAPSTPQVGSGDLFGAVVQQESGGRPGIPGPHTQYGQPHGMTQMLDGTAKAMAEKLGLPWQPELLSDTGPQGARYQQALGHAYLDEGLQKFGGDTRKALMYYHGGPDQSKWGPKTRAYADAVLARVGHAPMAVPQHNSGAVLAQAQAAIAAGADPEQVKARAAALGVSL